MHLLVGLDSAAVRTVAQRQVKTGRLQTLAHIREALVLQLGVFLARGHVGNRKMRENAFADQARQLGARKDILHGLLTFPRREAEPRHAGIQLVVYGDRLAGALCCRADEFCGLAVVHRHGDAVLCRRVHILLVHIAKDEDRRFDTRLAQLHALRDGRYRKIRCIHLLQPLSHLHGTVTVCVRLNDTQNRRLRLLADHAIIMLDRTEVDLRPSAVLIYFHCFRHSNRTVWFLIY